MHEKRTEKHGQARHSLPDDLKPIFDDFVADYKFLARSTTVQRLSRTRYLRK